MKKRKYTKGYHVDFRQKNTKKSSEVLTAKIESQALIQIKPESHNIQSLDLSASANTKITKADLTTRPLQLEKIQSPDMESEKTAVQSTIVAPATSMKEAKRALRNSIRENRKELKAASSSAAQQADPLLLYIILAILIPPLAVGLLYGIGTEFWISLVLTLIFWIPGVIYSLIKVVTH